MLRITFSVLIPLATARTSGMEKPTPVIQKDSLLEGPGPGIIQEKKSGVCVCKDKSTNEIHKDKAY